MTRQVLERTIKEFRKDNLTDWAATLTYYGILALFPALIALVSIVGLLGQSTVDSLISNIQAIPAAGQAKTIIINTIRHLSEHRRAAGIAFVGGLVVAVWSASGYIGAFMRASNAIYGKAEGRPLWKLRPLQMGLTLLLLILTALSAAAVVVSGPLADHVSQAVGLGDTGKTIFEIAKWPVVALIVSFMISLLYYVAPNVKQPGFRLITPGGILAVVVWLVASAAFALYVSNFGSYDKTYGTFAGIVIFLMWLWITNIAVLLGEELNAELERSRELAVGLPAEREIQLPPRAVPKEG